MKRQILWAVIAVCVYLPAYAGYCQPQLTEKISSELEEAFLERPKTLGGETDRSALKGPSKREQPPLTEGEKWRARLAALLDISEAPAPEGLNLRLLEASGTRFVVAVFDSGEKDVVHKARQVAWPRVKGLFAGSAVPALHIVPITGGSFSAGRTFYTIINDRDGFSVIYIPQKEARKVSLAFSGGEGTFLTPDGFVCRIRRFAPDAGGVQ